MLLAGRTLGRLLPSRLAQVSAFARASNTCCDDAEISQNDYERLSEDTLHRLTDYLDVLPDVVQCDPAYDISYAMGVLTAYISPKVGTYVINKQSPNRQIWLSSPMSGPKRYDYVSGRWIYKRDGASLHELLQKEFEKIFDSKQIKFLELEKK
ncbi:fxn protein [Aphelenchoides avenae]|nr:fxn protein [Aphelenchus avenae]